MRLLKGSTICCRAFALSVYYARRRNRFASSEVQLTNGSCTPTKRRKKLRQSRTSSSEEPALDRADSAARLRGKGFCVRLDRSSRRSCRLECPHWTKRQRDESTGNFEFPLPAVVRHRAS